MWGENVPSLLVRCSGDDDSIADLILLVVAILLLHPWCLSAFGRSLASDSALSFVGHQLWWIWPQFVHVILTLLFVPAPAKCQCTCLLFYLPEVIHTSSDLNTWVQIKAQVGRHVLMSRQLGHVAAPWKDYRRARWTRISWKDIRRHHPYFGQRHQ